MPFAPTDTSKQYVPYNSVHEDWEGRIRDNEEDKSLVVTPSGEHFLRRTFSEYPHKVCNAAYVLVVINYLA